MSNESKLSYADRLASVNAKRKEMGDPPLNPPEQKIVGAITFPKFDPAILQAYVKKHNLPF